MHTCAFCKDPVPAYDKPRKAHLVIAKDMEGHVHTHGDLDKKDEIKELVETAAYDLGIPFDKNGKPPAEVVFHNRQRIGDILMMTCAIRDFKQAFPETRVNVVTTAAHIWDNNPYIDRTLVPTDTNTIKIGPSRGTNQSNRIDWHFANAYRISIEDSLKIRIPQGESRPDIWLTDEEWNAPRLFPAPYWVICITGEKSWGCKTYPYEKWQQVVDMNPDLLFVQIGAIEDNPPRLQGANVIDHVGKTQSKDTGIRDLFKLFLNAEGSIGLVSFHMHLSGALYKPAVVVAGAREPVSFTRFPYHQYLATDGTLPCSIPACWHCAIDKCTNLVETPERHEKKVPKCVEMIDPEEVNAAINRYYKGGLLKKGVPCSKPKFKNIVKLDKKTAAFDWGRGAIDEPDWQFIEEAIKKHNVKTVLEFGAGLSTTLFAGRVEKIVSYETDQDWLNKVKSQNTKPDLRLWNGRDADIDVEFDLAFVDGPANGQNRDHATRLAADHARIVIVHDCRDWEKKWENQYLKPGFDGPIHGGRWCNLWIKSPSFVKHGAPAVIVNPKKKKIKVVSTARGWGGCARSVTTIMKMLLKEGHDVEFIPFRNKITSKEFQDALKNGLMDVKVNTEYSSVRENCDTLLVYADDFVWEFPQMGDVFSGIKANKKVMMVNYRRGGIGEIPWTKNWDKYLFLNSGQERDLLSIHPNARTGVLPPCTDLSVFFDAKICYDLPLRIVRHSSQGDTKFDKNKDPELIVRALERKDSVIHMLPGPSWAADTDNFKKHPRTGIPFVIRRFLELGNLFWYSLPEGYFDMGPRVILEAMAAGLPILADPWGGAVDRVTPECGWICSKEEQLEVIRTVTSDELAKKGQAARERARNEFVPERWLAELV